MATRTVYGVILRGDDTPWAGAQVVFRLTPGSYTEDVQYPASTVWATTDAAGAFAAELWTNEAGAEASVWEAHLPDGTRFRFTMPEGTAPIQLSALRMLGITPGDEQYPTLLRIVEDEIEALTGTAITSAMYAAEAANTAAENADASAAASVASVGVAIANVDAAKAAAYTAADAATAAAANADAVYTPLWGYERGPYQQVGRRIFARELGKPLWWSGTAWVDVMGVPDDTLYVGPMTFARASAATFTGGGTSGVLQQQHSAAYSQEYS